MNKHTRLIVSLLFIGIIVLAVAITRFYSRTEKSADSSKSQNGIVKRLNFDSSGNRAFKNGEGLVGIIDSSERIIVSPEWESIRFTNNKNHTKDFEQQFSSSKSYETTQSLNSVQEELVTQLSKDIVDQIFNATVADW